MQDGRWTTITPSQFDHERAALEYIRRHLPDAEPYRAWSNFTFTADTGHVYEIDLLVAARSGLYLIEIKSLHGRLTNSGPNWIADNQKSVRTFDNPLHLADLKAKRLRSLLDRQAAKQKLKVRLPFIQGAVFLSAPDLQVQLDEHQLHWVYGPEPNPGQPAGPLPGIWTGLLGALPRDERRQVTPDLSKALPKLLKEVGIARSRRYEQVGSWQLEAKPFDVGPTWQDHLAEHAQFAHEHRRIRIYLLERNSAKAERASIERAARREMIALHGISHPGIVQVDTMEPHEGGPALIFRHDPRAVRLDHFMVQHGERLDVGTRIGMVRQLVEAIGYAHGRRLHHRSLSARGVLVMPGQRQRGEPEEAAWLRPHLQISDWQAATRGPDSVGGSADALRISQSSRLGPHLERSAEAYLAPELSAPLPDPVALDVFGLGTLAYLLLSGQPPAASRAELLARLAKEDGLRPSSMVDSVSEFMDELVQAATTPIPARRLSSVAELLEMLQLVEEEFTAPPSVAEEEIDVLEAKIGDTVADWQIKKKLGTGSTSRAFLAQNTRTGALEVLKVALSDEKANRLVHEARVLRGLHKDSRVIRLAREDPIPVPPRTMIVLEHAGEVTLARKLREDGRLTVDELETYSDYLFGAVDHLQGEGIFHRDIKPDNIAIRIRPNRTRQLVLFDFSLAALPVDEIEAGTPRYIDPFLGTTTRPVYDEQAERYAVAVTLHEMASGEIPVWGDDHTNPLHTEGPPVLAVEAFDPAIRNALVGFFHRALHRDATRRHASLKEMRDAWQQAFRQSDHTAPVGSDHPDAEVETTVADRDEAAAKATRATVLEASGLTPRAVSAAHRLDATTVGDLLGLGSKQLFTLPGLGAKTRGELQQRLRDWRARLGEPDSTALPSRNRTEAKAEIAAETIRGEAEPGHDGRSSADLARVGLDAVTAFLVPQHPNQKQVEAVRLLLGLPDESGHLSDLPPWPLQAQVAKRIEVTAGRVAQYLMAERKRWYADPVLASVRAELITLLAESGRVMKATELATALLMRRGSAEQAEPVRRAVALAVVRAAVEIDPLSAEPRFAARRHGDPAPDSRNRNRLLIALEVATDESPDTPSAPALLDLADALGKAADRLAELEVLPSPATVLRELAAVTGNVGDGGFRLDDRRMVQLAAVASARAAASPRLEIYPRDLDPVRALRLTQAGLVPPSVGNRPAELREKDIQERVRARFPEMPSLPSHPRLDHLLAEAGFPLIYRNRAYHARPGTGSSTRMSSHRRRSTDTRMTVWNAASPELAAALRAEQQLVRTGEEGGFRALTVRTDRYPDAQQELVNRLNARACNVAGRFLAQLRTLVEARPKPTWETVLAADAADPNSRDALKLAEFAARTWQQLRPELLALPDRRLPLLLFDAAPLARYGAMELLEELADLARGGAGAVWLLCPVEDPGQLPRLDAAVVPVAQDEWVTLPDAWVANEHRNGRPPR
ncbi:BREX system serine/threonine kinase PglW [Plantactinospora mayteni]|uniref:non-specific serine/threonine protein kinase n=1 Tax=Plantactinospora mayteni TaxID=566021 RepID=A0ABQ4EPI9_9ACTN|nr:BREX system serine/threonine kinase PglW [Plantactinospora mayteni]GIG96558.1 protein kinase [Plantactinospora mayteni]